MAVKGNGRGSLRYRL